MAVMLVVGIKVNDLLGPESALNAVASDLSSAIDDARNEAIVSGRVVHFEFALGNTKDARQFYRSIMEPLPGKEKQAEEEEFLLTVREWRELPSEVRFDTVILGEEEPFTDGTVSVAIQPDGTMPSFLIRMWAPAMDENHTKASGWACVQVAGLLGQARVLNRFIEPEFLREDTFE